LQISPSEGNSEGFFLFPDLISALQSIQNQKNPQKGSIGEDKNRKWNRTSRMGIKN